MKQIEDISLPRMNNGAHFTFVSNILARAEADTAVKEKAANLVTALHDALAVEDEALKISQKACSQTRLPRQTQSVTHSMPATRKLSRDFRQSPSPTWQRQPRSWRSTSRTTESAPPTSSTRRLVCL